MTSDYLVFGRAIETCSGVLTQSTSTQKFSPPIGDSALRLPTVEAQYCNPLSSVVRASSPTCLNAKCIKATHVSDGPLMGKILHRSESFCLASRVA